MDRYAAFCSPLCEVDVAAVADWLTAIPLDQWPQQDRMYADQPYPAMVSDLEWFGFGRVTDKLVGDLLAIAGGGAPGLRTDHRMLSIVMPGQKVAEHDDIQSETWRVRIHVPLVTGPEALMFFRISGGGAESFHLETGTAYLVNTETPHWLSNEGGKPRAHLFFDIREG